jgi:hypothetical protein
MGWGRAAGVLIALLISCALIDVARGGDLVECEPQRVTGGYWAYRIIDGRECWYQGQPGKPKNELFWPRAPSAPQPVDREAETPPDPSSRLVAAQPEKPETVEAVPEERRATAAGQVLAFTCCWPELEEPAPLPQPTQEPAPLPQPTQEPQAWLLALLPLGLYALWWIARPRRALRAVRAQHAGRVAATQPHPPAPAMHTGPKESATSLFVSPINEQQYSSLENLVGRHLTQWLDQVAREDAGAGHATSSLENLVEWHLTPWLDQAVRGRLVTGREREPAL